MTIKPAPIIAVPNVPTTRVTVTSMGLMILPRVIVRRGTGQATKVRIFKREWE